MQNLSAICAGLFAIPAPQNAKYLKINTASNALMFVTNVPTNAPK